MGFLSCFGGSTVAEPTPQNATPTATASSQPNGTVPPPKPTNGVPAISEASTRTILRENTKIRQLLEEAQTEISRLTSRIKLLERQDTNKAIPPVPSTQVFERTGSDPDQLQDAIVKLQQLEQQLGAANDKIKVMETEMSGTRSQLVAAEAAITAADQAHSEAMKSHQATVTELQYTREKLQIVQRQADTSAAALDELYDQTASFLRQQGFDVPTDRPGTVTTTQGVADVTTGVAAAGTLGTQTQGLHTVQQEMGQRIESLSRQVEVLTVEKTALQQQYEQAFDQAQTWHEEVLRLQAELEEAHTRTAAATGTGPVTTHTAHTAVPTLAVAGGTLAATQVARSAHASSASQQPQPHSVSGLTQQPQPHSVSGLTQQPQPHSVSGLTQQLTELQRENVALVAEAQSARELAQTATQQVAKLEASLTACQTELATLQAQVCGTQAHVSQSNNEARVTELSERLAAAEQEAQSAKQEADELRREVESHSWAAEGTAGQVDMLMKDITSLRKKCGDLEANVRMKDEMLALLQTQLAEVAEVDLDGVVAAATARPPALPPSLGSKALPHA